MINTFDPDALIIGGGVLEATEEFRQWFIRQIRAGMPLRHAEQADIPIHVIPNGDCAGALGAAIGTLQFIDVVADLWPVLFLRPNGSELV
jgi:predicted NBD/HSP70 family sugar kinase